MRREELRAARAGGLQGPNDVVPEAFSEDMPRHEPGAMRALLLPFIVLFVGVVVGMYVSGGILGGSWGILAALASADVAIALNVGGIAALLVAIYYCMRYTRNTKKFQPGTRRRSTTHGTSTKV